MTTHLARSRLDAWRPWLALVGFGLALLSVTTAAASPQNAADGAESVARITFSLGKTFTFLFVTLGPLKVLGPFASMTRGQDVAFKRRLAVRSTAIAALAIVVATTVGTKILGSWGISVEALLLTAGVVLFLVALRMVLEQYVPRAEAPEPSKPAEPPKTSALAFSPLAFPTIVTPYGIAVLIVLVMLRAGTTTLGEILAVTSVVLALDLLGMLFADRILKTPFVAAALNVLGVVMGVLQVALGVQAILLALRLVAHVPP